VHQISLNSRGTLPPEQLRAMAARLAPGADVRTWRELLPLLADLLALIDGSLFIFGTIFFLAAGLGVMNTMLMATHERIREFGMLKAIGAAPWRIARDVVAESMLLGVVGSVAGAVIGAAAALALERHGLDIAALAGGASLAGVAFDPVWRASFDAAALPRPMLIMATTAVVATLYPALLAARLDPVQAMQHV
jgi:ABC-type antimicrobial peptide transport system permease subunit